MIQDYIITINQRKLIIVRKFLYFSIVSQLIYNVQRIRFLINPESIMQQIVISFDWIVLITCFVNMIVSKFTERLDLVYPSLLIIIIRLYVHTIDSDTYNISIKEGYSYMQVSHNVIEILAVQIIINFV